MIIPHCIISQDCFLDCDSKMSPLFLATFLCLPLCLLFLARLDPNAKRFLTMVCHFDSKYFEEFEFVAATDSAVPCAMMIDLAKNLNYSLHNGKDEAVCTTLSLSCFIKLGIKFFSSVSMC